MKNIRLLTYLLPALLFLACENALEDNSDSLYDESLPDNELVFEVIATVTPLSSHISLKDTLWVSIQFEDSTFIDKISEQEVTLPLSESRFIVQMEVADLIDNRAAGFKAFTKKGSIVKVENGLITANFGHPEKRPELKLGLVFEDIGRYALIFHNYPNPNLEDAKQVCEDKDCENSWYDLLFYQDRYTQELKYKAFIDYRFNVGQLIASESELNRYLDISTYTNAIYPVFVR